MPSDFYSYRPIRALPSFPTRRSSDLLSHVVGRDQRLYFYYEVYDPALDQQGAPSLKTSLAFYRGRVKVFETRSEEHTSELQSPCNLVCRLLLDKKKQ